MPLKVWTKRSQMSRIRSGKWIGDLATWAAVAGATISM